MRKIIVVAQILGVLLGNALAQSIDPGVGLGGQSTEQTVPLSTALKDWEATYGIHIIYDDRIVDGANTTIPLVQQGSSYEALKAMIGGKPISFKKVGANTVALTAEEEQAKPGSIRGTVTDKDTGEPLANVNLFIRDLDIGAATNTLGQYTIDLVLPGRYRLEVRYIGYVTLKKFVDVGEDESVTVDFAMEISPIILEEISVTAQKATQNLQDVPIAITALDGDYLREQQVFTAEELSLYTPSLHIFAEATNTEFYTIRGVGRTNEDIGSDSGVSLFIDDVYIARQGAANLALFDIERVEVLRGPQGTLWGKNATGGAINIITRKPGDDVSGHIGADLGAYGTMNLRAGASTPLIDHKLFGRIAFDSRERDGLYKSLVTGDLGNNIDTQTLRGSLQYIPSISTNAFLTADWQRTRQEGVLKSVIVDVPGTLYILKDFFKATFPTQESDIRTSRSGTPGKQGLQQFGLNLTVRHKFSAADLTLVSGYRKEESYHLEDNDHAPERSGEVFSDQDSWTFSQEARLTSRGTGPLSWTGGLYLFHEDGGRNQSRYSDFYGPGGLVGPGSPEEQNATTTFEQSIKTDSYAAFAQLNYAITDRLNLTAGARYTQDKKDYSINAYAVANVPGGSDYSLFIPDGPFEASDAKTWNEFTPRAVLEYQLTEGINTYFSYTEGFKSGGYNGSPDNAAGVVPFKPEHVRTYEFGQKGRLFKNRLSVNLAEFFTDFKDLQVQGFDIKTGSPLTSNAADAEIKGVELELAALISKGFNFNLGASWLDHQFKDYYIEVFDPTIEDGPPFRIVDKKGDRIGLIPNYNVHVGLQYTRPMKGGAQLSVSGDLAMVDKTITEFNTMWSDSYEVLDFEVTWIPPERKWDATLRLENALDKDYYRGGGPVPDIDDKIARLGLMADPRILSLTLNRWF